MAEIKSLCEGCKKWGISRDCVPTCPNFGYSASTGKSLAGFIVKQKKVAYDRDQEMKTGGPKTMTELAQWMKEGKEDDVVLYATHNPTVMGLLQELKKLAEMKAVAHTKPTLTIV